MRLEFKLKKKVKSRWKLKLLTGALIVAGLGGLYVSPIGQAGVELFQKTWTMIQEHAHWRLNQVIVEGHKRTDTHTIMDKLEMTKDQPMNTLSLEEARDRLLQLPWVKEAVVERHLPDTLIIRITEKTPIALWQNNQSYQPLDEKGHPIKDDKLLPADLILVVGPDAPENTLSLLAALEQVPTINTLTRSAVRIEKRRWNLHLMDAETGLEILLPETDFDKALKRLAKQNEKEDLLKKNVQAIDVRLKDRIILHPKKSSARKKDRKK
ncbi:MAG: cell division protein FtsQ/DivIB [Alphaproteobacteria bacterium]